MPRVLFVCTGNICRSPIAEGILRSWLVRDLVPDVDVESCGTYAQEAAPASSHGVAICKEHGIDISGHRSQLLHRALIDRADLILGMEAAHAYEIERIAPDSFRKVHLLGGYGAADDDDGVDLSIFDPIGGSEDDYRRCFSMIENHLKRCYPEVREVIKVVARTAREGGA